MTQSSAWRSVLMRWTTSFAIVFAILLSWRWYILVSPPYWDAVYGVWMEAEFLERTNFDYVRLRYEEKHGTIGGAYSYMTSVLPTLVAIGFRLDPDGRRVIIGYHLFVIVCSSALAAGVWTILRPRAGVVGATLCCAALVTTPAYSAQIEMLGMEMPTALAALAAASLVWSRRWRAAAGASLIAFFVKATGMLATATSLAYLIVRWIGLRRRRGPVGLQIARAALIHLMVLGVELLILTWGGTTAYHLAARNRPEAAGAASALVWFPDLVLFYSVGLIAAALYQTSIRIGSKNGVRRLARRLSADPVVLYCAGFIVLVAFATMRVILIPRYIVVTLPFFYLAAGRMLFISGRSSTIPALLLAGVVAFNLANQFGRFYPDISAALGPQYARTGAMLERSREYYADHLSNQAAIRRIESVCPHEPIFAGHPFVYVMTIPRMGYATRPLHGYSLNGFSSFFPEFVEATSANPAAFPVEPIFIKVANTYYFRSILMAIPNPSGGDELFYKDDLGSPLTVFRKRRSDATETANWSLNRFLPWADPADRATAIADGLLKMHRSTDSLETLRSGLDAYRPSAVLSARLAAQYIARGDTNSAVVACVEGLDVGQGSEAPWNGASPAAVELQRLLQEGPVGLRALADGAVAVRSSLGGRAETQLQAAATSPNAGACAEYYLAMLRYQQGRYDEAIQLLRRVLAERPRDAAAHHLVGLSQCRRGQWREAAQSFDRTLSVAPGWLSAQRNRRSVQSRLMQTAPAGARAAAR